MTDHRDEATGAVTIQPDDLGLSIDMLDSDRLGQWAANGSNISEWASKGWLINELQRLSGAIGVAVKDIGSLRAQVAALRAEKATQRELIVRADSYLSLLWHRYVDPNRKDADLSYNVERTIGDLREAGKR